MLYHVSIVKMCKDFDESFIYGKPGFRDIKCIGSLLLNLPKDVYHAQKAR